MHTQTSPVVIPEFKNPIDAKLLKYHSSLLEARENLIKIIHSCLRQQSLRSPDMERQPSHPSGAAGIGMLTTSSTISSSDPNKLLTYRQQADSDSESERRNFSHNVNRTNITTSSFRSPPNDPSLLPNGSRSLSFIAIQAFGLGLICALCLSSIVLAVAQSSALWRLPAFFASLSIFHFLEFWTTARFNVPNARASSFLLWNNPEYNYAHAMATVEILLSHTLLPQSIRNIGGAIMLGSSFSIVVGTLLIVLGQSTRSAAMITAGTNFNHVPARAHAEGHVLVTRGIYAFIRHPSYTGFFWWAIGTQVLVGNKLCLLGYTVVLWRFFSRRILGEERFLVEFFGKDYEDYRQRVGTGIPFIR